MMRRAFLGTVAVGAATSVAGCSSSCPDSEGPAPSQTVTRGTDGSGFEALPSGSWPSPQFDAANTGYTSATPPLDQPSVRWQTTLQRLSSGAEPDAPSPPTVAGETVLTAIGSGVVALSLGDGSEQWRRELTPATVQSDVRYGTEPVPPVAAGSRVIVSTADGVVALEITDGRVAWRATGVSGTGVPAVADDMVIVPTAGGLRAFDTSDGSQQWVANVDATMPALVNDTVVAGGDRTVALQRATGDQQWAHRERIRGYPVVADGTVYLGTADGMIGRSLTDGTERWRIDRGRFGPPVVTPESVYAAEQPGEAGDATFAFDRPADGRPDPRWCSRVGDGTVTAAASNAVLASESSGLVAFTAQFGEASWQYPLETPTVPPAILDGAVVSVSRDGTVVGIGGE